MTASTSNIVQRPATVWSTEKKKGGSAAVTGAAFASATNVNGVLDLCSAAWKTEHVVTATSIGKASSVLT
jgi:hypothetical protein